MKAKEFESVRLAYKPLSTAHLSQDYVSWLNDPEVYKYLESRGGYDLNKLEKFLQDVERLDILFWAIHLKSNGQHIGNIKIDPVNTIHGTGELGILMGKKSEWGKGFGKEAMESVIQYCFSKIKLRKICLGVVADHEMAVNLYQKVGFIREGLFVRHLKYDNKYYDVVKMAIFNPEFSYET